MTYGPCVVENALVNTFKKMWLNEPTAVIATVQTLIALVIAFGVELTAEQGATILAAVTAIGGLLIHSQVTSTQALQNYTDAVNAAQAPVPPPEVP